MRKVASTKRGKLGGINPFSRLFYIGRGTGSLVPIRMKCILIWNNTGRPDVFVSEWFETWQAKAARQDAPASQLAAGGFMRGQSGRKAPASLLVSELEKSDKIVSSVGTGSTSAVTENLALIS